MSEYSSEIFSHEGDDNNTVFHIMNNYNKEFIKLILGGFTSFDKQGNEIIKQGKKGDIIHFTPDNQKGERIYEIIEKKGKLDVEKMDSDSDSDSGSDSGSDSDSDDGLIYDPEYDPNAHENDNNEYFNRPVHGEKNRRNKNK